MIKLSDLEFSASPLNSTRLNTSPATHTHTPTDDSDHSQANSINFNSPHTFPTVTVASEPALLQLPVNLDAVGLPSSNDSEQTFYSECNDEDATTRLGQITMETRSTRKFLIKHHPYLQQKQTLSSFGSSLNSKSYIQRPSINLMKKLNSKKFDEPVSSVEYTTNTTNSSSNNRSGRSSRSNNSGLNEQYDYNLLKFTDTAPAFSSQSHRQQKSAYFQSSLRRRQLKSLTTASALTTELNQGYKRQLQQARTRATSRSVAKQSGEEAARCLEDLCDFSCCGVEEGGEGKAKDTSCEQFYDEQEEHSSGYYSSYHSVDLISSSGGSCVGANNMVTRQQSN